MRGMSGDRLDVGGQVRILVEFMRCSDKMFPSIFYFVSGAKNEDAFLQGSNGYISSGIHGSARAAAFLH